MLLDCWKEDSWHRQSGEVIEIKSKLYQDILKMSGQLSVDRSGHAE